MPGFDTGSVMYALNVDFTGNSLTSGTAQVNTNGQLLIGSTANPNIKVGSLTSPQGTMSIGYSAPNITLDIVPIKTGSLVFIQKQIASNSASLTFTTGTNIYTTHFFVFSGFAPVTSTANLLVQMSNNGGVSYSAVNYTGGFNYSAYNSATVNNVNSSAGFILTGPSSTNTNGLNGYCYIINCNAPAVPAVNGQVSYLDTTLATRAFGSAGGSHSSITGVNAFQVLFSTGNINSGNVSLFGVRPS